MRQKDDAVLPVRAWLGSDLTNEERLFALLVGIVGLSNSKAYRLAFSSKCSMNSAAVMACHVLREPKVQKALWRLAQMHRDGGLAFNERALKLDF